jgi:hypothetical protein
MTADFDFSELNKLAADLGAAEVRVVPFVRKAVEVTARNVKDDWRKGAKRTGLDGYAATIDYDMKLDTDGVIGEEVGPNLGKPQGSFGLVEDAPGDVRSAPQHAGRSAAKNAEADFIRGIAKAGEDAFG